MLDSSNKNDKFNKGAQLELDKDSLKYNFLVVSALIWLLLAFDFGMFIEITLVENLLTTHVTLFMFEKYQCTSAYRFVERHLSVERCGKT